MKQRGTTCGIRFTDWIRLYPITLGGKGVRMGGGVQPGGEGVRVGGGRGTGLGTKVAVTGAVRVA